MQLAVQSWSPNSSDCGIVSSDMQHWLTIPQKLTPALRARCQHFSVIVHHQQIEPALAEEAEILESDTVFVRQVSLCGDGAPWVYGRVVMPIDVYHAHIERVKAVNNQPFGEALLYQDDSIIRDPFEYACLTQAHPLVENIARCIGSQPTPLWARRSLFHLSGKFALVTDVFLKNIPPYDAFE